MKKRRTITARLAKDVIIRQIAEGNVVRNGGSARVACALCGGPISTCEKTQWEHMHALELGGADDETNIRLCHLTCSKRKTFGPTHTSVGGDIHAIRHADRMGKKHRGEVKAKKKIPGRSLSHPTLKRKFDGTVVERT